MFRRSASSILVLLVVICFILQCKLPQDPSDPLNTRVELMIRNSLWIQNNLSITDTVDKPIQIGIVINLPENIDSIRLSVKADGKSLFDTLLQSFSSSNKDTIWKVMTFPDTGYKLVSIVPYSQAVNLLPIFAGITIAKKTSTVADNSPPEVTIITPANDTGVTNAENYIVDMLCSDASGIDSVYAVFNGIMTSAVLVNGHYKVTITGLVAGVNNTIQLTVRDKSVTGLKTTKTLIIKYAQSFTVAYNGNGNSSGTVSADPGKYETGATVTVKSNTGNLVKTGFTFVGWATSASGTDVYKGEDTFKIGTSDVTLYALWKQNTTFTLTVSSTNGQVAISPNATAFDSGTIVTLTPVPSSNYHFSGWSGALSGTANPATIIMNSAKSVIASFEANVPNAFALTVLASNGTVQKTPDKTQYDSGSVVTLTAVPNAGYQFTGWSGGITGTTNPSSISMNAAKSVIANFALNTYQLTVLAGTGGSISTPTGLFPKTVNYGEATSLSASVDTNYSFVNWTITPSTAGTITNATSATSATVVLISGDATVQANFVIKPYQLYVTSTIGGTISKPTSGPASVTPGNSVAIQVDFNTTDYNFVNWTVTSGTAGFVDASLPSTYVIPSSNATVRANLVSLPKITLSPVRQTTVWGDVCQPITTSVTGGTPPYSYKWIWAAGGTDVGWDTPTATPYMYAPAGTYIYMVEVTDANGYKSMSNTSTHIVTENVVN